MGHPAFAAGTGRGCESWPDNMPFFGLSGITQPLLLVQGVDVKAGPTTCRFFGLSGITQPLLLVQGVDVKAGPATKGGCPIQNVFWLEWDNTALDQEVPGVRGKRPLVGTARHLLFLVRRWHSLAGAGYLHIPVDTLPIRGAICRKATGSSNGRQIRCFAGHPGPYGP
jgi:hypothetical protein